MKALKYKDSIDKWLENYFISKDGYEKTIYDSMSYSLNIGGKRIRPLLFLYTYSLFKDEIDDVLDIAGAIEMIHTYSLIHDDLPAMDDDDLRRGMPTNHIKYGDAIAILAGDGLLNEAMNIMFQYCIESESQLAVKACSYISKSAGAAGMIAGQIVDIESEGKKISIEKLKYMHSKKTGALINAAIVSAAILAGADSTEIEKLSEYGTKLGLAFQIKDDVLDVIGDESKLGKKTLSDENKNKSNFITEYGLEECEKQCIKLTEECLELLKSLGKDTEALEDITKYLLYRES
ncbi:polyprenyl synthetase family protein [Clostridium cellulovorans]|uniref:Farnesyl diphosphate synthase n=1 Tax=Clostridium cellulovorans (strain ATCC 35296 / DSM 3052 / OCM 3 / 743B) TaxID=573061 RepID=D9SLU9_CLOC7|nr:farnesyl diphosphate synthase [Clostridium cellulovorans]ADL51680.1 Polyprenyl synthetase [Clostridium cellulovorans 743B]